MSTHEVLLAARNATLIVAFIVVPVIVWLVRRVR